MVDLTTAIEMNVRAIKDTKLEACKRMGGPTDLSPMMAWVTDDNSMNVALVDVKGTAVEYMPPVLSLVAQQMPKFVIFIAESLAKQCADRDEVDELLATHQPGGFAKEVAERGPLSGITELIAFNGLDTHTGEQVQGYVSFTYDDFGQPVFSEPHITNVPDEYKDHANVTMIFSQFHRFMESMREQNQAE